MQRTFKPMCGLALAAAVAVGAAASHVGAAVLFTTQDDFTGWGVGNANTAAPTATGDTDGSTVNGVGNTVNPGSTGTAGALTITVPSGSTYGSTNSYGEQNNAGFLSALSSASTLTLNFNATNLTGGTYFQPILLLNFSGAYDQISPTSTTSSATYSTATYTLPAGLPSAPSASLTYFQLGVIANTNDTGTFTVDDIATPSVPEPASLSILGGAALLCMRRRSRT